MPPASKPGSPWGGCTELQWLHSLHGISCVPEKQAANSSTRSKASGAATHVPSAAPLTGEARLATSERSATPDVLDKVCYYTTSWLREKTDLDVQLCTLPPSACGSAALRARRVMTRLDAAVRGMPAASQATRAFDDQNSITQVCGKVLYPPQPTTSRTCPEHSLKHKMRYKLYYITATRTASCSSQRFLWGNEVASLHVKCF